MHNLKKTSYALFLVLAVALMAVSPTTLHSQDQNKRGRKKEAAVLRRAGQPATPPTAQEAVGVPTGAAMTRAFRAGRDLLVKKGVPFEPNLLLERNWHGRLRDALAQVPEFQEVRRGGRKLKGAQIADTLFLPEKIELEGDTVIVAKRLIFEGRDVFIKGNHDIHIFTVEPATLTEQVTEANQAQLLNVGFNASSKLRRLASTLRPAQSGNITIDTSGAGRKEWLEAEQQRKRATSQSGVRKIKAGFTTDSATAQTSQDGSGSRGADGMNGDPGLPGTNGENGVNGANGVCGGNVNGSPGSGGKSGSTGYDGNNGAHGEDGGNGRPITVTIATGDTQRYTLISKGGDGGWGGRGGNGGTGGRGGDGGKGGNGADCPCNQGASGEGGNGGYMGAGGYGGDGGDGGRGGNGGNGGPIIINHPVGYDTGKIFVDTDGGLQGHGGGQGTGGLNGSSGARGQPGKGATGLNCYGTAGRDGSEGGPPIYNTGYGNHGELGAWGERGRPGGITYVPTREVLEGGGGGGSSKGGNIETYNYYECTSYYWVLYNSWDDGQTWFEVDRWYAGCW